MLHRIIYALLFGLICALLLAPIVPVYAHDKVIEEYAQLYLPGKDNQERWEWLSKNLKDLASADQANAIGLFGLPTEKYIKQPKISLVIAKKLDNDSRTKSTTFLTVRFEHGKVATLTIHTFEYASQEIREIGPS